MATIELDPMFVRAIRLMNSTMVRDADEQIRIMLEEAIKLKYGTTKTISVIEKESSAKREVPRKEEVVVAESGMDSGRPSPEVVDLDDDEFGLGILEDDLTCVVCHGMGVTARNQLVECIECHSLYHQECHSPPVTDINDVRSVWYCAACSKTINKPPARASPKFMERAETSPFKRTENKPSSGRSTPIAMLNLPKSPAGTSSSKLTSSGNSSKVALPKVNIVSADKRLQDMKKKAAAKLHEKRKHPK